MNSYYELVVKALRERGFSRIEGRKGSHEKWSDGRIQVLLPCNCKSRHTANAVLKDAGIGKKF
ncbi:MAG: type II toxin-antitoxin system HicA family toxin [Comamonas sp.]